MSTAEAVARPIRSLIPARLVGGIVEMFLGVNAAGKSLEQVTKPLTSTDQRVPAATSAPSRARPHDHWLCQGVNDQRS